MSSTEVTQIDADGARRDNQLTIAWPESDEGIASPDQVREWAELHDEDGHVWTAKILRDCADAMTRA